MGSALVSHLSVAAYPVGGQTRGQRTSCGCSAAVTRVCSDLDCRHSARGSLDMRESLRRIQGVNSEKRGYWICVLQ